jgi:hypothetical protein
MAYNAMLARESVRQSVGPALIGQAGEERGVKNIKQMSHMGLQQDHIFLASLSS